MKRYLDFNEEEIKDIVSCYSNGLSTVKLGSKYEVSHKVIARILETQGIKRTGVGQRKYALDENYFDIIDTPDKAYIFGFLYADGSNCITKGTISMSLEEGDEYILEKIREKINSQKPLVFLDMSNKHDFGYTYKNQYALIMHSVHMCKALEQAGMVPNKSLVLEFPKTLDRSLYSHFIRGYYDGNGSVFRTIKNPYNHAVVVTITSTNNFCMTLKDICKQELDIDAKIYDASCHNGVTKVFTLSGRNLSEIFLKWIYMDANMFLKRKFDRYIKYYVTDIPLSV